MDEQVREAYARILARCEEAPGPLETPCLLFGGATDPDGYGAVSVGGRTTQAHRLAHLARTGESPPCVMHRCDVPACVADGHLVGGTQAENLADCRAKGRTPGPPHPRGEANPNARLTAPEVRRIRAMLAAGHSQRAVARRFGVGQHAVQLISSGRTWSHLP